jgi:hypothetical protein
VCVKRFDESKVGSVHGAYVGDVELRLRGPIGIFAIPKFGAQPPISDCPARPRHVNFDFEYNLAFSDVLYWDSKSPALSILLSSILCNPDEKAKTVVKDAFFLCN